MSLNLDFVLYHTWGYRGGEVGQFMYRDRWRIRGLVFGARRAGATVIETANLSTFNAQ